jgi:hypothetical protein
VVGVLTGRMSAAIFVDKHKSLAGLRPAGLEKVFLILSSVLAIH